MDWYSLNTLTNLPPKTIVVHALYINIHVIVYKYTCTSF